MKRIEKVTDERVFSMMIDIKDSIDNYNVIDYEKLQEKHKSTVNVIIAILREQQIFIKANNEYLWIGDSPTLSMAKIITKRYYKKSKENQNRVKENTQKIALAKKHQESIERTEKMLQEKQNEEELISDPLNFEVPLDAFQDSGTANVNPALMPIEDYQRLQIESYIRQTTNLQSEIEELKRLNDELKSEIESNKYHIKLQNQEFRVISSKNKDAEDEIYRLTTEKKSEKKPIRLFGIKIGSIG